MLNNNLPTIDLIIYGNVLVFIFLRFSDLSNNFFSIILTFKMMEKMFIIIIKYGFMPYMID